MKSILNARFFSGKTYHQFNLFLCVFLIFNTLNAQKIPTEIVEGIPTENAVEIIKDAAKELKFQILRQNTNLQTVETRFFEWTSLVITNRAKLFFEAKNDSVVITMIEHQYKSTEGWTDSPTNVSKKNHDKYLGAFAKKIKEIASKKNSTTTNNVAAIPSNKTEKNNTVKNAKGIYENFAFAKTEDPDMPIMAIHKNGNILGFQLNNNQQVTGISFKKDINSESFTLFFDEEGNPTNGTFGNYIYTFKKVDDKNYKIITHNTSGTLIDEKNIAYNSFDPNQLLNYEGKKGPNANNIEFSSLKFSDLNEWIQNSNYVLNVVSCGVALPSGFGAIGPCGTLLIGEILEVLPKDHVYYDELVLAKEMLSLVTFTTPTGFLDKLSTVVGGLATSSNEINKLLNNYFPEEETLPVLETSKNMYTLTNGLAQVTVKYNQITSEKTKKIAVFLLNDDATLTFLDDKFIENSQGEVVFDIPFTGNYEVQISYNDEVKTKVNFSVNGKNTASNLSFVNANCVSFSFNATMTIKQFHSNGKVSNMPFQPFSIEAGRCKELHRNKIGNATLEPLKINWSGNTFYAVFASVENFFGVTDVSVSATGKISSDGSKIEYITLKSSKNYLSSREWL